ncbi:hypothetical protein KP509_05G054100 [Ceratopteris richardii]|uniref:RNA helicase n=1 Tax=Ceratopteris richardii TaxID=49495 RepID=A0A8T2UYC3_CERRI|nr:hypothetical protein KP509_05G054100 [Ceratopteris richardii]KAH7437049.1 hypothetical protein KP509_05G054100 [Ceratopteris richardii]
MASTASLGLTHTFQALSLETGCRKMAKPATGSIITRLSSSFFGDSSHTFTPSCTLGANQPSRLFNAMCIRMESTSFIKDDEWKRPAVALADYAVAEADLDFTGYSRNGHGGTYPDMEENGSFSASSDVSVDKRGLEISNLGLKAELVEALRKRGITNLFPIQEAVMKPATDGLDLIARAKTGTGKTLAFGIPIIQNLLLENERDRRRYRFPRVLVLAPTRELAMQVEKEFTESAPGLTTLCVYGGVSITAQQRKLQRGVDIAVGTPGRVIDLLERGSLVLNEVRFLVLDEADQMLAVGFEEEVERILDNVPANRQSMLFSATMPSWVNQLARKYLKNPLRIDLVGQNEEKLAEGIKMFSIRCPEGAKRSVLSDLITVYGKGGKTIVFTQTKKDADEVSLSMNRMLGTEALHGDISQAQREKTLAAFRNGKFSVLVATDVAARGLDIPNVDLIIHFEIPNDPETFVHRSGRTGRAGKEGITILMHTDSQMRTVRMIERDVGCKFEVIGVPSSQDVLRASSDQAQDALSKVHPDLTAVFLPTAEKLLKEQGATALAAAIAHLSGFTQPPASRSLITHQEGWMTLQFTRAQRWGGLLSPGGVMGALASIYPPAADEVGKILMLDPAEGMGAVFDLPEDVAKELLAIPLGPENSIQAISKLPTLQYNDAPRDRYGKFSSRGSPRRSSRPFGRSGGDAGWSSGGGARSRSNSRADDFDSWGSGSSRMDSRSGGWKSNPGYFQDSGAQRSQQTCFICNQPGHRAANCPRR